MPAESLLQRIRCWDSVLLAEFDELLRSHLVKLIGRGKKDALVEALVCDTFSRAYQNKDKFYRTPDGLSDRGEGDDESVLPCFRVWLKRIAYHLFCDWKKNEEASRRRHLDEASIASRQDSPDVAVEKAELHRRFVDLISRLPPPQREVIERLYQGGYTSNRIAKDMGISQGQVSGYHRSGLETLRRWMGE